MEKKKEIQFVATKLMLLLMKKLKIIAILE